MSGPGGRVTRIAEGAYRVEHDGRSEVVYVAGPPDDRWIFWRGRVFRGDLTRPRTTGEPRSRPGGGRERTMALAAPMPARVSRVDVRPGSAVRKGDTVLVLEAMKMELPLRAPADAVVSAVRCREGDLVAADAVLIELS